MNKKMGIIYKIGVITSFLSLAGFAEAITGRGDTTISGIMFGVGLLCCLTEYIK